MTSEQPQTNLESSWLRTALLGRHPRRRLIRAVVVIAVSFVLFRFILLPVQVVGGSMLPTFKDRGWNFANRLSYVWKSPQRGDVVCIQLAAGRRVMLLKRIVALPGDTVAFREGRLIVNGKVVSEPYVKTDCDWDEAERRLGPDEYYVVGDNRSMPADDHWHGITDGWRIVGKILL